MQQPLHASHCFHLHCAQEKYCTCVAEGTWLAAMLVGASAKPFACNTLSVTPKQGYITCIDRLRILSFQLQLRLVCYVTLRSS